MSSFLTKTNLSSEDVKKCPNVLLFGILNCKTCPTMLTRKFWEVLAQTTASERDNFFLAPYLILGGKPDIYKMTVFFLLFTGFWAKMCTFFCILLHIYPAITRRQSMRYTSSLRSCQPSVYHTKMGDSRFAPFPTEQQANLPACSPHCPFNAQRQAGKL